MTNTDLPPDGIEACGQCGASLRYRWTKSPWHTQAMKSVDRCENCRESLERSKEKRRRELVGPERIRESGIANERRGESLAPDIWPDMQVDADNQDAVDALQGWVAGQHGLYLWGATGTGKSTLARAALLDCCRRCQECLWMSEKQLVQDLKSFKREAFERAWSVPVLCIDDIASRPMDISLVTAYRDIFDGREECGGKTLITGQLEPAEVLKCWRVDNVIRQDISYRLRSVLGGSATTEGRYVEVRGDNRRRRRG